MRRRTSRDRDVRQLISPGYMISLPSSHLPDFVMVALLHEKQLAMQGVFLIQGVPGDEIVKIGAVLPRLGAQDPSEPLRLLLPRPEGARHLDGHIGVRQV